MKYFKECKTKQQLKARFKMLLKENHPDNGGDLATMQAINAEYQNLEKVLPDVPGSENEAPKAKRAGSRMKATGEEKGETDLSGLSDTVKQAVAQAAHIPGVEVEVCGSWVWVSGDTYNVRNLLKECGFRYSGKKKMWYFHDECDGTKYHKWRKETDMGTIRTKYGSRTMHHQEVCLG